ncbi:MAG: toll/interleukin-1 receptor domain-containing protein [Acidobacteria bacterium]|nr:toll/interleukin-1 receptor domain-containing protein [Acidobacteriota bacterium]
MKHHIFLSHPQPDQDLIENLAARLLEVGIKAWVYSLDKTLSQDTWKEIEARIDQAELFAFAASVHSRDATGQHRELELALNKIENSMTSPKLLPILIGEIEFRTLPDRLRSINGIRLSAYTVQSTAHQIAKTFFPDLFTTSREQAWKYPKPGQWLQVSNIDPGIEEYFTPGDQLYFRRISPLGLFECYSPKLDDLFWISPENVKLSDIVGADAPQKPIVPLRFQYQTSYEHERLGLNEMRKRREANGSA